MEAGSQFSVHTQQSDDLFLGAWQAQQDLEPARKHPSLSVGVPTLEVRSLRKTFLSWISGNVKVRLNVYAEKTWVWGLPLKRTDLSPQNGEGQLSPTCRI